MFSTLLFVAFLLWATGLTIVWLKGHHLAEALAFGFGLAMLGVSWLAFILVFTLGYHWGFILTPVILLASGLFFFTRLKKPEIDFTWTKRQNLAWALVTGGLTLLIWWLLYTHMLPARSDGWYSAGATWGDIALHLSLINHFAQQTVPNLQFPLYSGAKLTYPFLPDFLSGLLVRGGWSIQAALLIPSLITSVCLIQALFFVGYRLFKRVSIAALGLPLFFLNGSFIASLLAWQSWRSSGQGLFAFLGAIPNDFTDIIPQNLRFTNFISTILLPQRTFMFGMLGVCLVLIIVLEVVQHNRSKNWLILAAILTGLLPFVHVHSFFVACLLLAALMIVQPKRNWLLAWLIIIVLALPQLVWQFTGSFHGGFVHFFLGWVRQPGENLFTFWWRTFGVLVPVIVLVPWFFKRGKENNPIVSISVAMLTLFLLTQLIIFQPYDYDNIKFIMYVSWWGSLLLAWLVVQWAKKPLLRDIGVVLVIFMILPGLLSLTHEVESNYVFTTPSDIQVGKWIEQTIPADALVLTGDKHNNPVSALAGRSIVMGYRGWLWSYGIDYTQRESDILAIFSGSANATDLLAQYKIDYVVIGQDELANWGADPTYFAAHYPFSWEKDGYLIYKIR